MRPHVISTVLEPRIGTLSEIQHLPQDTRIRSAHPPPPKYTLLSIVHPADGS